MHANITIQYDTMTQVQKVLLKYDLALFEAEFFLFNLTCNMPFFILDKCFGLFFLLHSNLNVPQFEDLGT